jgi:hypothetical protein
VTITPVSPTRSGCRLEEPAEAESMNECQLPTVPTYMSVAELRVITLCCAEIHTDTPHHFQAVS